MAFLQVKFFGQIYRLLNPRTMLQNPPSPLHHRPSSTRPRNLLDLPPELILIIASSLNDAADTMSLKLAHPALYALIALEKLPWDSPAHRALMRRLILASSSLLQRNFASTATTAAAKTAHQPPHKDRKRPDPDLDLSIPCYLCRKFLPHTAFALTSYDSHGDAWGAVLPGWLHTPQCVDCLDQSHALPIHTYVLVSAGHPLNRSPEEGPATLRVCLSCRRLRRAVDWGSRCEECVEWCGKTSYPYRVGIEGVSGSQEDWYS